MESFISKVFNTGSNSSSSNEGISSSQMEGNGSPKTPSSYATERMSNTNGGGESLDDIIESTRRSQVSPSGLARRGTMSPTGVGYESRYTGFPGYTGSNSSSSSVYSPNSGYSFGSSGVNSRKSGYSSSSSPVPASRMSGIRSPGMRPVPESQKSLGYEPVSAETQGVYDHHTNKYYSQGPVPSMSPPRSPRSGSGYSNGSSGYSNGSSGYSNGSSGYSNGSSGYSNGSGSGYSNGSGSGYSNGSSGYSNGSLRSVNPETQRVIDHHTNKYYSQGPVPSMSPPRSPRSGYSNGSMSPSEYSNGSMSPPGSGMSNMSNNLFSSRSRMSNMSPSRSPPLSQEQQRIYDHNMRKYYSQGPVPSMSPGSPSSKLSSLSMASSSARGPYYSNDSMSSPSSGYSNGSLSPRSQRINQYNSRFSNQSSDDDALASMSLRSPGSPGSPNSNGRFLYSS